MLKKVTYIDQQIQDYIDRLQYDNLLIEEVIWHCGTVNICEPYIIAKLFNSFPKIQRSGFPFDLKLSKN